MKKIVQILLFIFSISFVQGQELNKKYYLLGTLHDYMGRHYPKNNPTKWNFIMNLHQDKWGEIKRIEEVTGKRFKRRKKKKNCNGCENIFDLKSINRAWTLNSFYDFEKNKGMKDLIGFTYYTGTLNCEKIVNADRDEQFSFIAGLFLTAGEKSNEIYKINLYNSPDRIECAKTLLQELNSEIITVEIVDGIPVGYFIEFKPPEKLKTILDNEIERRNTLANSKS